MRMLYLTTCLLAAGTLFAAAPDEAALKTAMKAIAPANGALGKKIAAKDASAAADAKQLATWFAGPSGKFFKAKKWDDAMAFNKTAVTSYKSVAKAAAAGKWDEAAAAQKAAGGTCQGCHAAHRTPKGADGNYHVK